MGIFYTVTTEKNGKLCGGGVAIYVDANLLSKFELKFTIETAYFQSISVNIKISHNKSMNIISIYRTPDTCMDTFTDSIDNLLKKNKQKTYLCGNFNIDLIKAYNHNKTEYFINIIFGMGFHPLITKPTRITSYSATLIDNIFTNDSEFRTKSGIIITDISGHLPVFTCSTGKYKKKYYAKKISQRNMTEKDAFLDELCKTDWTSTMHSIDVNNCYNDFIKTFIRILNEHCPIETRNQHQKLVEKP